MKPTPVNIKNKRASFDYEFIDDKFIIERTQQVLCLPELR